MNSFPDGNLLMQNEQFIHSSNRHAFYSHLVKFLPMYLCLTAVTVDSFATLSVTEVHVWGLCLF